MKIFKVPTRREKDEHTGYLWTTSKREASKTFKEYADAEQGDKIKELNLNMNKRDVINFLNQHCSHPDNG